MFERFSKKLPLGVYWKTLENSRSPPYCSLFERFSRVHECTQTEAKSGRSLLPPRSSVQKKKHGQCFKSVKERRKTVGMRFPQGLSPGLAIHVAHLSRESFEKTFTTPATIQSAFLEGFLIFPYIPDLFGRQTNTSLPLEAAVKKPFKKTIEKPSKKKKHKTYTSPFRAAKPAQSSPSLKRRFSQRRSK